MKLRSIVLLFLIFFICCSDFANSARMTNANQVQTDAKTEVKTVTATVATTVKAKTESATEVNLKAKSEKTDTAVATAAKAKTDTKKQEGITLTEIDPLAGKPESRASYDAHAHNLPREGGHDMFNLYSQGLIEGEPKDDLMKGGGPTYWEGWGKFIHFDDQPEIHFPKEFYVNYEYFSQKVLKSDYNKRDDVGFVNIPSKFHFFFSLTENNLILLSSRNRKLHKVKDTLHIDLIQPIPYDNQERGGVQNLGDFDEGHCIQVFTSIPEEGANPEFKVSKDEGKPQTWVFCLDSVNDMSELMKAMIRIKILKQKVAGENFVSDTRRPSITKFLKPKVTPKIERYNGPGANYYKDGFWILLQDWSQCTLKCGGGVQHQQWLCQPPLRGGKPCMGLSIRKRPCNLQPCPKVLAIDGQKKNEIDIIKKPHVISLPWSSRLQRYIECEVKESDILYIRRDVPNMIGKPVKYPGRLVMTNRTLAMYEDDSFEHSIFTFNLADTTIATYEKDYCCFFALSMDKKFRICGFEDYCGTKEKPQFVKEWTHDVQLFQDKCFVPLDKKDWRKDIHRDEEDADGGHIDADQDALNAKEQVIKHNLKEKQELELEKKITNTQETAMKAIRKELKLERLIQREEKLKEKEKLRDLLKLKVKEEKKQDCLERALKAREDENMKGRDNILAEKEIERIKVDAKKEVENERANLKRKILDYKKKAKRKQLQLEQQIELIRSKMAKNLLLANKNGDMLICKNSAKDVELVQKYCDSNFVTDYKRNIECKDMENFCPICCENEFGQMYLNNRDECYAMCDELIRGDLKGDWVWTQHNAETWKK